MLQGTVEDAAWKISENGFGTVATRDAGYYGKGFLSPFSHSFLDFPSCISLNNQSTKITIKESISPVHLNMRIDMLEFQME